jgi:hypothetical protein
MVVRRCCGALQLSVCFAEASLVFQWWQYCKPAAPASPASVACRPHGPPCSVVVTLLCWWTAMHPGLGAAEHIVRHLASQGSDVCAAVWRLIPWLQCMAIGLVCCSHWRAAHCQHPGPCWYQPSDSLRHARHVPLDGWASGPLSSFGVGWVGFRGLDEWPVMSRRVPLAACCWVTTDWQLQINQEHWEHLDGWA